MNTIIYGEPGSGKSRACCQMKEPVLYLNLEDSLADKNNRLEKLIKKYFADRIIDRIHVLQTKNYAVDGVSSLQKWMTETEKIIVSGDKYKTIIIDGITPLREWATALWLQRTGRKNPATAGDFADINDIVREKLYPLMLFGKATDIDIVMTAQMRDDYTNDIKTGRVANLKEWQTYNVNTIMKLVCENNRYYLVCEKSILGCWTEEVTSKNIYEVMKKREIT